MVRVGATAALLALVPSCASRSAAAPGERSGPLRYDLRLDVAPAEELVHVTAELEGLTGPLTLDFAEQYAFARLEPRLVGDARATAPDGRPLACTRPDPYELWVDPDGATEATLTWSVRVDHRRTQEVETAFDHYEHPYLAADHGMLLTAAIFPVPRHPDINATVRIVVPEGWQVTAPWPQVEPEVEPPVWRPDPRGLRNDIVALGQWTRVEGSAGGLDYAILLAPGQERLAEVVADRLPPVVEAEVELFGGAPQPKYMFVFGRPDTPQGYGGSPKGNSMALFVSPDLPDDFVREGVTHLVAHEYHHTWMKARCEPLDELRFVIEGFTDYYAYLVPWRLGMTSDERLATTFGGKLAEAEVSLSRFGKDLARAGGPDFFAGRDAYTACYSGGLGLALWTDMALRDVGSDLDRFLRAFYGDEEWSASRRPSLADWEALLRQELGDELAEAQLDAVSAADGIDWVGLFGLLDVEVERGEAPFERTPRANFDGTTVTFLDGGGAGAAIGLQPGDRLLEVNGRDVADEASIRAAWAAPEDGRIVVTLERGNERLVVDVPEPTATTYRVPTGVVDLLR